MTTRTFEHRLWTWLRALGWLGILGLLAASAIAELTSPAFGWTMGDFVFAWTVLLGAGLLVEGFSVAIKSPRVRIAIGLAVVSLVLALWAWAVA